MKKEEAELKLKLAAQAEAEKQLQQTVSIFPEIRKAEASKMK